LVEIQSSIQLKLIKIKCTSNMSTRKVAINNKEIMASWVKVSKLIEIFLNKLKHNRQILLRILMTRVSLLLLILLRKIKRSQVKMVKDWIVSSVSYKKLGKIILCNHHHILKTHLFHLGTRKQRCRCMIIEYLIRLKIAVFNKI